MSHVFKAMEVVYMVPKHGGTDQKRMTMLSTSSWPEVCNRLARTMGYDDDEEFSISYRLSNTTKGTKNSLEDEDDYIGIVTTLASRRRNSAPLQVIIIDNNNKSVNNVLLFRSFIDKFSQVDHSESSKGKKASKKAAEIAKARLEATHQTGIDAIVQELKLQYPMCLQHRMHCWTGHSSKHHVQLTEMRFRAWGTEIVSGLTTV